MLTFYVICTLDHPINPLIRAIETRAHNADQASFNVRRLHPGATIVGVVGGANAKSEEEALRVFLAEGSGEPLTVRENLVVYGTLFAACIVLQAFGWVTGQASACVAYWMVSRGQPR